MTSMTTKEHIILTVNGERRELEVDPSRPLLEVLREDLDLTGSKRACDDGECGSCMVLLGQKGVMSCLLPVSRAQNKEITTIEGLAEDGELHPLQEAFIEVGASQCGFCIPGIIIQAGMLLKHKPDPSREDVVKYLARNICRCTGYTKVIDAVLYAAELKRGGERRSKANDGNGHMVGGRIDHLDTLKEVIGEAKYAGDLKVEGMLYAKVLRSPHHHARILSMDISEAEAMPGVETVITAKDVPGKMFMLNGRPQIYVFPQDKVRYLGEGLAAVGAVSEEIAEEAVRRIRVEYEPLPAVLDLIDAMKDDAPLIFSPAPNATEVGKVVQGDVEKGFAEADVVVENTYTTPRWEHLAMEPEAALAYLDEEDRMTVHAPFHHSFRAHRFIAEMLALDQDKVRIICPTMGGGFGSRGDFYAASMAALLAFKTKRPVRIVYTREESLLSSGKSPSYHMKYKTGATRDGKLVAIEMELLTNGGTWANYMAPYTGGEEMIMFGTLATSKAPKGALTHTTGPYYVPNYRGRTREVCTNGPRSTPLRGTQGPPLAFAFESQMDQLAAKLGMDPLEFRLKNALEVGSRTHYGQVMQESVGAKATLEAMRGPYAEAQRWAASGNSDPTSPWKRGAGLAATWRSIIGQGDSRNVNPVLAAVDLLEDGRVQVFAGVVEEGQGPKTTLAQIASQELGVPLESLVMTVGDTYLAPYAVETNSSKITIMVGQAVQNASRQLKEALGQEAAKILEDTSENIQIQDGSAFSSRFPEEKLSLGQLATHLREGGVPSKYEGSFVWERSDDYDGPNVLYAYTAQVSEVEVNVETGQVKVLRVAHASDAGTVVNPKALEGQIEGGIAFGMGFALKEKFDPDKTRGLKDYKLVTIREAPEEVKVLFVGEPLSIGPFGAKGAGEMSVIAPVPSIINGIADATGARIFDLPATPEKVLEALSNTQKEMPSYDTFQMREGVDSTRDVGNLEEPEVGSEYASDEGGVHLR